MKFPHNASCKVWHSNVLPSPAKNDHRHFVHIVFSGHVDNPRKQETLTQRCDIVGTASATTQQHRGNVPACWVALLRPGQSNHAI